MRGSGNAADFLRYCYFVEDIVSGVLSDKARE